MFSTVGNYLDTWRSVRICNQSRHRDALAQLPQGLYEYWRKTAPLEFKGLPASPLFFSLAAEGLMDFFDCVRAGPRPCALPSNAADSVWHAWRRFSPAGLEQFCHKHFGRSISHLDKEAMAGTQDAALASCLVLARRAEGLPAPGTALPRLFRLDAKLRMPGGYGYKVLGERIAFHRLDGAGMPHGALFQVGALAPLALLEAGLVTQDEYLEYERRSKDATGSDGGGGSSSGSRDCDNDSDGGSDGGSSCGGGCGGGD